MQNVMPGLSNVTALLTALEGARLDDTAKKFVIDALAAGAPGERNDEGVKGTRKSYRTAMAWLRGAPGRAKLARDANARPKKRAGAYQVRCPKAEGFHYKKQSIAGTNISP